MRDLSEIAQPPELTDGRLRLRALRAADKAAVVAALNDELAGRFLWQPPFPYAESDFDEFLAATGDGWSRDHNAHWAIAGADGDDWLGSISLDVAEERQAGEIGYQVAPWARGTGVATAAVRLVRDWALDDLGLERVEIDADVENIASQRVALAAGFRFEGVRRGYLTARGLRRDETSFAIVPSDPRAPAAPLPWPCLGDGRVVLRPFAPDDAPAVARACADPDAAEWMFDLPGSCSAADAEQFIIGTQRDLVTGTRARLAVVPASDDRLLGSVCLEFTWELGIAEFGAWVTRESRREGIAVAAGRLMVRWAFEELGLARLEATTYPGNAAAQGLATSLGFRREGLLRGVLPATPGRDRQGRAGPRADGSLPPRDDQVLFGLLKDEWEPADG